MATLQVWELFSLGGAHSQVGMLPGLAPQNLTIGTTSARSAALDKATIGVRLIADSDFYLTGGSSTITAGSSTGIKIKANAPEYFGTPLGGNFYLAAITTA